MSDPTWDFDQFVRSRPIHKCRSLRENVLTHSFPPYVPFIHEARGVCSRHFSFSELWQTQQTSLTAQLHVPAEDRSAPFSMADLFVFPFLNDWTYSKLLIDPVLITMQVWVRMKPNAAGSCRESPKETATAAKAVPHLQKKWPENNASQSPTF